MKSAEKFESKNSPENPLISQRIKKMVSMSVDDKRDMRRSMHSRSFEIISIKESAKKRERKNILIKDCMMLNQDIQLETESANKEN